MREKQGCVYSKERIPALLVGKYFPAGMLLPVRTVENLFVVITYS